LRKTIGKATAELQRRQQNAGVAPTDRQLNNIRLLEKKYRCKTFVEISSLVEKLKGRLHLLLSRIELRLADEQRSIVRRAPANMIFRDKESKVTESASVHQIRRYWKTVVGVKKTFEHQNPLLVAWEQSLPEHPEQVDPMDQLDSSLWQRVVRKLKPWKASGPDGLQGFWWKRFGTANKALYNLIHLHLTSGAHLPQRWISDGRIVLLHKSGSRSDPSNFRPIACLNTCYKLLTGYISVYLDQYATERHIFAGEQRALQKGVWGCTHALLLDQALIADAKDQKQRSISVGWIDYAKAFDSVPHDYIQWLFRAMQVPLPLRNFISGLMKSWRVKYEVKGPGGQIERSNFLRIRSGVLQGDSFSPLLFCLAMVPISHALNSSNICYTTASGKLTKTQLSLSHQFYMDDLKLYADSEENLTELLRIVKAISKAINMKVNLKKCAVAHFEPERLKRKKVPKPATPSVGDDIETLMGGKTYKYLGIDQTFGSEESVSWDRVKDKCTERFQRVWTSDLTFRQKVEVHNTAIIPALTYVSSNVIKGSGKYDALLSEGEQLDKRFRRIMVERKARSKASAVSRLYLTAEKGGYGLKSVRDSMEESTIYTWAYLCTRVDLRSVYNLFDKMANRSKRSVITDARHVLKAYNIEVEIDTATSTVTIEEVKYDKATTLARHVVELMRNVNNNKRYEVWKELKLAGRVLRSKQAVDLRVSFEWLRKGQISSTGVRNVLAVQEGCLITRSHPGSKHTNGGTDCRMCKGTIETIEHVISCCPKWLSTLYIDRHDSVARNIYYILCRKYDLQPPHYTQRVEPVKENDRCKLYWNQPVQTRAIVRHNKPDLIAFDKIKKTAIIIEVAVSWFTGIEKQIELKRNRYCVNGNYDEELTFPYPRGDNVASELRSQGWKITFLPIVIGATGEVLSELSEQIRDGLSLSWQASLKLIERLQRSAVLGTSRIVQNHLSN
jgi:Reverse transcriptase (RNA-dependent DNA polymerase)